MEDDEQHKKDLAEVDGWIQGYREGYSDAMKIVREAITTLTNALANDVKEKREEQLRKEGTWGTSSY